MNFKPHSTSLCVVQITFSLFFKLCFPKIQIFVSWIVFRRVNSTPMFCDFVIEKMVLNLGHCLPRSKELPHFTFNLWHHVKFIHLLPSPHDSNSKGPSWRPTRKTYYTFSPHFTSDANSKVCCILVFSPTCKTRPLTRPVCTFIHSLGLTKSILIPHSSLLSLAQTLSRIRDFGDNLVVASWLRWKGKCPWRQNKTCWRVGCYAQWLRWDYVRSNAHDESDESVDRRQWTPMLPHYPSIVALCTVSCPRPRHNEESASELVWLDQIGWAVQLIGMVCVRWDGRPGWHPTHSPHGLVEMDKGINHNITCSG